MAFQKGKAKTGGKTKGTPNKITKDAKSLFISIMERQVDKIEAALEELRGESADKYLTCVSKLMPYFMPKQLDIKSDGEQLPAPVINLLPPKHELDV